MFSGLRNIRSGKRKYVERGSKEGFFLSIFLDPELFIILRRTIQTNVIDITRTEDFTFIETFQKVTVDGRANPAGQFFFSIIFCIGRQLNDSASETPL